jgi:(p)ppGpp synthase/HD superfamily hydrolase
MSTLDRAIEIAVAAHFGQVDKAGKPYILHPLRVMMAQESDEARAAAVLHDVVEDSDIGFCDLTQEGVDAAIVQAVFDLTRNADEPYAAYVERAGANPIARAVKIADLRDNLSPDRPCPESLRPRYEKALARLIELG